jgi:transposase
MENGREQRGLMIAATTRISQKYGAWAVPSQTQNGTWYRVDLAGETPQCSCPDYTTHQQKCKHIYAVEFTLQRESRPDGTTVETRTVRVTYGQNWPAYNAAQTNEKSTIEGLLRALCAGIPQPAQQRGRPRLPLPDVTFSAVMKIYTTFSGRRATSDLRECKAKGHIDAAPHYNSVFNYLGDTRLTPILKALVEESAAPLKAVETNFAVDSSGFSTCVFERWYDEKYGRMHSEHVWLKVHLMTGTTTNIVTSVEVTTPEGSDHKQFAGLVEGTAKTFQIAEVSADKAYLSKRNMELVNSLGATPYIAFKAGTVANNGCESWAKTYHYFQFNRQEFLTHYHKRSNVESTFSMMKRKFGASIRSKTPTAQINEVLCKVICHNLSVLVHSIYELGIAPTFGKSA